MKMIPMPEVGDRVILKEVPDDGMNIAQPEVEVKIVESPDTVFDVELGDWQVGIDLEENALVNVKWDDEAKVWRN